MRTENDPLSYAVIGEAMAVHRELGPGLREECYHQGLATRLRASGVEHLSKPRRELVHRGVVADVFEPDFVVPAGLVPELKHLVGAFEPEHFLQLKSYLKFWKLRVGLLLDFGKDRLLQQRYVYDDPPAVVPSADQLFAGTPAEAAVRGVAATVVESVRRVVGAHGFGYRDTTYTGLLRADFSVEGVRCQLNPVATVTVGGTPVGDSTFAGCVVGQALAVKVLSQREAIRPADRAIVQTWLRLLDLPAGVIVHFGKTALELQWVRPSTHRNES